MFEVVKHGVMYTVGGANQATWNVGGLKLNAEKANPVFNQSFNCVRPHSRSCKMLICY